MYTIERRPGGEIALIDGSKKLVWTKSVPNLKKLELVQKASCSFFRYRSDNRILRATCMENHFVSASENGTVTVSEKASGATTFTTKVNGDLVDLKGAGNQIAVLYFNKQAMRHELTVIEFFDVFNGIDSLTFLKASIMGPAPILAGEPQIYEQTYTVPIPSLDAIAFTTSKIHLTPQTLVLHSATLGALFKVSPGALSARRPVSEELLKAALDSSLLATDVETEMPYAPNLPLELVGYIMDDGNRIVQDSKSPANPVLSCEPGSTESETVCQLAGYDPITFTPVSRYDGLHDSFSKLETSGVLTALIVFLGTLIYKIKFSRKPLF